ncbi:diacylglycerol kinase [Nitriliruptor alkaliphilus]|uniref:NAD(P)H-dependent amine dehydrogenase family protein n=1 Tax=Nitriliruptor alkaliphilus TaxID=427918 RepID=UPI000696BEE0|nr:diacylglycerol kinase [Nitriliruptor alkaliphilus]
MTYRVVQWSTGHVGAAALRGIIAHPQMELVGVWVSSEAKEGRDAGELAGLDHLVGVAATQDADALLALKPDVICHTAMADHRLPEALADLQRFLRAGIDVVSSSPVFLQFPPGLVEGLAEPVEEAAEDGAASLFVNGIDPGFANDALPLAVSGICERIDELRVVEVMNYDTYAQAMILFDVMGFGQPLDATPMLLQPGILTLAWGQVVRQLAAGLDLELDEIVEFHERLPATETFDVDAGTIEAGTTAALRFEVRGLVDGVARVVLEHATRLHDDLAPDWPQPAGKGCYRVVVTGAPNIICDLQLWGEDGDHNTGAIQATAMRLVNAIPHVADAKPGIVTALDLPQVAGRGLVTR